MNRRHRIVKRLITGLLLALPAGAMAQNADPSTSSSAIKEWEALSKRGDAEAQFALAEAYKWGKGVKPDLKKAEMYYGKAAAQGHMQASDEYGLMLFDRGEKEVAFPYVKAASDRGDARAQYLVAIAHFNGDLAPKDWVRAYALMSLAQTAGLPQASVALPKFDQFIPLAQRQQGVALSQQIASEAETTRNRQIASAGLGTAVVPPPPAPPPPVQTMPRTVIPAPESAIAAAQQTAGGANPRTAGADFARPAVVAPPPAPKPASVIAASAPPKPAAAKPGAPRGLRLARPLLLAAAAAGGCSLAPSGLAPMPMRSGPSSSLARSSPGIPGSTFLSELSSSCKLADSVRKRHAAPAPSSLRQASPACPCGTEPHVQPGR